MIHTSKADEDLGVNKKRSFSKAMKKLTTELSQLKYSTSEIAHYLMIDEQKVKEYLNART